MGSEQGAFEWLAKNHTSFAIAYLYGKLLRGKTLSLPEIIYEQGLCISQDFWQLKLERRNTP